MVQSLGPPTLVPVVGNNNKVDDSEHLGLYFASERPTILYVDHI